MIRVCLSGARGRMGHMLSEMIVQSDDLQLGAALERADHPALGSVEAPGVVLLGDAEAAIAAADLVLDFSLPASVLAHAAMAASLHKPLVTGATGFSGEEREQLKDLARRIPVLCSSNMSRGVWVLGQLVAQASQALGPDYDAEIFEIHHKHKQDAPSGTALSLARCIDLPRKSTIANRTGKRQPGEVGIAAARGGDVTGEHQVYFLGEGEQVILTHRATSRAHFCRGALAAVRFLARAPKGFYSMDDVFSERKET